MGECAREFYSLSLNVEENSAHVSLIAKPAKSEGCPWIVYEAAQVMTHLEKKSYMIKKDEDIEGLEVGSFPYTSLQDAFENALIDTTSQYHVVSNNCASLPVKMMDNLDLDPMDPEIITFAAERLSSGGADLAAYPSGVQMIADAIDAYGVVEDFVAASIQAQLYASNISVATESNSFPHEKNRWE